MTQSVDFLCTYSLLNHNGVKFVPYEMIFFYEGRKEQRFWDGQKAVYVVLVGSTVVLPCINRRNVWTDWTDEEEDQQVCTGHDCNSSVGSRPPNQCS